MDSRFYVFAYLILSFAYVAGCVAYFNSVTRTVTLSRQHASSAAGPDATPADDASTDTEKAVRAVLSADSAAFACAVVPVAYAAVTGLLGTMIPRSPGSATTINPLWLLSTVAVVAAHMYFLTRIIGANNSLRAASDGVLTRAFTERHSSSFTYYRVFVGAVAIYTVINSLYLIANLDKVTALSYVGF